MLVPLKGLGVPVLLKVLWATTLREMLTLLVLDEILTAALAQVHVMATDSNDNEDTSTSSFSSLLSSSITEDKGCKE